MVIQPIQLFFVPLEQELLHELTPFVSFVAQPSKEKSWNTFHRAAASGFPGIAAITGCSRFATLLALEVFSHLMEKASPVPPCGNNTTNNQLTDRDCDIVVYIGGSVVAKLHRRYSSIADGRNKKDCVACLKDNQNSYDIPTSLTELLDRGGLTYISTIAISLFTELERKFRNCFDKLSGNVSLSTYRSAVIEEVTCIFIESTSQCNTSKETKDVVLTDVIKLYFKIRCHSQLRKIVRASRINKQLTKRQKSLRKTLKREI